jgi:hypothetical protein
MNPRALDASFYPSGIVERLLHANPTPLQTTLLLTSLYCIELGKTFIGTVGQKILYILWKVLVGNRFQSKGSTKERSSRYVPQRNRPFRHKGPGDEVDYDELYEQDIQIEKFIPLVPKPAEGETEDALSGEVTEESADTPTFNIDHTLFHHVDPAISTYSSREDDRKSKKGKLSDIEKLRRNGYNRYRFVSRSFVKRNGLSKGPSEYEGEG